MTKTRNDLVNQALAELGLLAAGQDPAAEDFDAVNDRVEPLFATLTARDIPAVPDIDDLDEIPDEVFFPLSTLLANEVAGLFGLLGVPAPPGIDPALAAETRMREIGYSRPTYEPLRTLWF